MAKEKIDLQDELRAYKFEFNLLQKIPCTKQENKEYQKLLKEGLSLPEDIYAYGYNDDETSTDFYTIYEAPLSESETKEYLMFKQLSLIKTIKNCVVFLLF